MTCPACGADVSERATFCPCGHALPALWSVNLSPAAYPSKPRQASKVVRGSLNSWERGTAPHHLSPDGTPSPYLDEKGERIGIKAWADTYRRKFQEAGLA